MEYRRFGRTDLAMPVLSCGGMRFQYKWQDVPDHEIPTDNQRNLEQTIFRAFDLGITHFETARGYGSSERQLGQALKQLPRDRLILQTKASPDSDPKAFRETLEGSLQRLQTDYMDLFGVHGINTPELLEKTLAPGGSLEVAKTLQAEGKIRWIGFSTHGPLEVIQNTIKTGQFDYVNLHWYYINQWNWPAIEMAQALDLGVFIISPADKGGMLYQPSAKLVELCKPLSPMVFNELFCLSHPQVHTLSVGAARPEDFTEHLQTLEHLKSAADLLPPIIARLEQAAIAALGADWVNSWREGLPSHGETPGGINIPTVLWLRNLAIAYDMVDYAKMRYNLLGQGGHWFPGNRAGEVATFNLRDCLRASPHADKIPAALLDAHQRLGGAVVNRLSQD